MAIRFCSFRLRKLVKTFKVFIFVAVFVSQVNGLTARKLEESSTGGDQGDTCTTSCVESPPPPSLPLPCPPPPELPPPSLPLPCPPPPELPPPPPKKPPTQYCPPPPACIYITCLPGNLYPIDSVLNGGEKASAASLLILISSGLLLLLAFW
ncbi:proline-rich receptor-like protein kinase PERK2 [Mangifera indica]|uniref:proline-rich receptor-like protein kinase PERK2 n=1 Tax=Mangifera indica TaxID=29780 RepID=UPI001CF97A5D|nr:proline-rich receptor-like protein kinase PERK2 [Mangifera indica]